MKKFLAGLALVLGVAALWQLRKNGAKRTPPRRQETGEEKRTRSVPAQVQPEPLQPESRTSAVATASPAPSSKAARQQEVSKQPPARSAEEVLNSATRQQLMSVYGIGPVLADRIIQNRPYAAAHDVVEKGIIPENTFVQLRKQLLEQSA